MRISEASVPTLPTGGTAQPAGDSIPTADGSLAPYGHPHFWQRALSRRQFLAAGAGAAGASLASGLFSNVLGATGVDPKPIPGVVAPGAPFHVRLPGHGIEPSTITDFKGLVGLANVGGTGTGWNRGDSTGTPLLFDIDVRFMRGAYVAQDGKLRHRTFAFT